MTALQWDSDRELLIQAAAILVSRGLSCDTGLAGTLVREADRETPGSVSLAIARAVVDANTPLPLWKRLRRKWRP